MVLRGPSIYREPVSRSRVVALEVQEANLGAANNNKVELEEATPEDRGERQHHSQKSQ